MAKSTESPTRDRFIAESEEAEAASRAERAANLFDLRRIIGGLFLVYGVILTVMGLSASQADVDKAAGVNVNLWTGVGMIVVAGLFLLWAFTRPLSRQLEEAEREQSELRERDGDGRFGRDGNGRGGTPEDERVGARAAN